MLPRLTAAETLRHATAVALGAGTLKREKAMQLHGHLERQAKARTSVRRPLAAPPERDA